MDRLLTEPWPSLLLPGHWANQFKHIPFFGTQAFFFHQGCSQIVNPPLYYMPLCSFCQQISPWTLKRIQFGFTETSKLEAYNSHHISFMSLQKSAAGCELCCLMCNALLDNKHTPAAPLQDDLPILLASAHTAYLDLNVSAPQLHEIVVQCGRRFVTLLAFAEEGSQAAESNSVAGRLPADVESQENFGGISKWLDYCVSNHKDCRISEIWQRNQDLSATEISELPSRFLDVGSDASNIRLVESVGAKGQYVTLSHRCKSLREENLWYPELLKPMTPRSGFRWSRLFLLLTRRLV